MYVYSSVILSADSTLSVDGTAIGVYNVSVGGNLIWNLLLFYSITLSDSSTLSVNGTTIEMHSLSSGGSSYLYVLYTTSPITLSDNSTLSIYGTTIGVYNMRVAVYWYLYVLYSSITSTNSTLSVYGTTIGAYNVSARFSWQLNVLQSYITLSAKSTLSIFVTTIETYNMSVGGDLLLYVLDSSITVSDDSTLTINGTRIGVHNVSVVGSASMKVTILYGPMSVSGMVTVRNASIDGVWSKWIDSTSIAGPGQVSIVNVNVTGAGSDVYTMDTISVPYVLASDAPTFHVSQNFVNNTLRTLSDGIYWCAVNISQRIVGFDSATAGVTASATRVLTRTVSHSHHTKSNTVLSTHTNSLIVTTTQSPPYGTITPAVTTTPTAPRSPTSTATVAATRSPTATATVAATTSPEPPLVNSTFLSQVVGELSAVHIVASTGAIAAGLPATWTATLRPCPRLLELLVLLHNSTCAPVPLTAIAPQSSALFANRKGFFAYLPKTAEVFLLNATAASVRLATIPSYTIDEEESLLLFTSLRALLGNGCGRRHPRRQPPCRHHRCEAGRVAGCRCFWHDDWCCDGWWCIRDGG